MGDAFCEQGMAPAGWVDSSQIGTVKLFPDAFEMDDMGEDNDTIGTGKSFPSMFEMGDMAENDDTGHERMKGTMSLVDQQLLEEKSQGSATDPSVAIQEVEKSISRVMKEVNGLLVRNPPASYTEFPGRSEAAKRSRQKKRSLEEQLRNWQNGVGTNRPMRRYSTGSQISDGPPSLVDCEEPDEKTVSERQREYGSQHSNDSQHSGVGQQQEQTKPDGKMGRSFGRRSSMGDAPDFFGGESFEKEPNMFRSQQTQSFAGGAKNTQSGRGPSVFDSLEWPEASPMEEIDRTRLRATGSSNSSFLESFPNTHPFKGSNDACGVNPADAEVNFTLIRVASTGSINSKSSCEPTSAVGRRGSLGAVGRGFSSPDRPPLSRTPGSSSIPAVSPPWHTPSPGGTVGRRPSFGSGSVASARTGYSSCDASRSSLGSSRASLGSDASRIVLVRNSLYNRENSRASLASSGRFVNSEASRTSMGSGRTGGGGSSDASRSSMATGRRGLIRDASRSSISTCKTDKTDRTDKTDPLSSDCSLSSPKSALQNLVNNPYRKGLTLEAIRNSAREGICGTGSPQGSRLKTSVRRSGGLTVKSPHTNRRKLAAGLAPPIPGSERSRRSSESLDRVSGFSANDRGPVNGEVPLALSPLRTRRKHKGKDKWGTNGEGHDSSSSISRGTDHQKDWRDESAYSPASQDVLSPTRSKRKGLVRSGRKERQSSLDMIATSMSPRSSRHKERRPEKFESKRDHLSRDGSRRSKLTSAADATPMSPSRVSRRKGQRKEGKDCSNATQDMDSKGRERRTSTKAFCTTRRRGSMGGSCEVGPELTKRRFGRRASTGSTDGNGYHLGQKHPRDENVERRRRSTAKSGTLENAEVIHDRHEIARNSRVEEQGRLHKRLSLSNLKNRKQRDDSRASEHSFESKRSGTSLKSFLSADN